jgi:hypothetical protein
LWQEENAQSDCQEYPLGVFETFHGAKLQNIVDVAKFFGNDLRKYACKVENYLLTLPH